MKKILLIGGIGIAGFGLYRYFKYQVDQALNYDYKIKDFRIVSVVGNDITISVAVDITNNSNFSLTINEYDLQMFFKNIPFATTKSNVAVTINPSSVFSVKAQGVVNTQDAKLAIIPFLSDVANKNPIDIQVSGVAKVTFMGVNSTVNMNKQKINYSVDLLKEYGLSGAFNKLVAKFPKVFDFLGIKK